MSNHTIRILLAKPSLDGHDRGVKVLAYALRDAGMEVIYSGLHQTPEHIAEVALQENVSIIGISILSGGYFQIAKAMVKALRDKELYDVPLIMGGVIPYKSIPMLQDIGITDVFPNDCKLKDIINRIKEICENQLRNEIN